MTLAPRGCRVAHQTVKEHSKISSPPFHLPIFLFTQFTAPLIPITVKTTFSTIMIYTRLHTITTRFQMEQRRWEKMPREEVKASGPGSGPGNNEAFPGSSKTANEIKIPENLQKYSKELEWECGVFSEQRLNFKDKDKTKAERVDEFWQRLKSSDRMKSWKATSEPAFLFATGGPYTTDDDIQTSVTRQSVRELVIELILRGSAVLYLSYPPRPGDPQGHSALLGSFILLIRRLYPDLPYEEPSGKEKRDIEKYFLAMVETIQQSMVAVHIVIHGLSGHKDQGEGESLLRLLYKEYAPKRSKSKTKVIIIPPTKDGWQEDLNVPEEHIFSEE
ncbi:hypothetical protein K491DRAFT_743632 [Lophiostoma macrostomum CBS 122681]|uniref:Uncharacterized protein n=1 Tax=Lophiostoma macrostomum CBS 122681 TaxID=1314788 RepID=A0A6A6SGM5_9PLEO|nr:hypothetical protein K491DRAFT_743632 [Lophiostoma macrostomum CBS 122681]